MGMDLYALDLPEEHENYNLCLAWWAWTPVAKFVHEHCELENPIYWFDHSELHSEPIVSADEARRVADKLYALLTEGVVAQYERDWLARVEKLPDEVCPACDGLGSSCSRRFFIPWRRTCSYCDGKKAVPSWEKGMRFYPEIVKELADYCDTSGGFRMWG
jgi:hypothetical protein